MSGISSKSPHVKSNLLTGLYPDPQRFLFGCFSAVVFARSYKPIRDVCEVSNQERIFVRPMKRKIVKLIKLKRTTRTGVSFTTYREFFTLFVFQGDPGEEAAIGSTEGVNGNGSEAKGEKVR